MQAFQGVRFSEAMFAHITALGQRASRTMTSIFGHSAGPVAATIQLDAIPRPALNLVYTLTL